MLATTFGNEFFSRADEAFDPAVEDWLAYAERLESILLQTKQIETRLSSVGATTSGLSLLQMYLQKHYSPKPSIIVEWKGYCRLFFCIRPVKRIL